MIAKDENEFMKHVKKVCKPPEVFIPIARYSKDGDCVEFFAKDDDFRAVRIDGLLTIYRSKENGEIIGSLIKGVSHIYDNIMKTMPAFGVFIQGKKVKLSHFFFANILSKELKDDDRLIINTYMQVEELAEAHKLETEFEFV